MKHLLVAVALCLAVPISHAQEGPAPEPMAPAAEATGPDAAEAESPAAGREDPDKEIVKERVRGRVLEFVDSMLEAAGDKLSEEEKKEILREIQAEFDEGARSGPGFTIDIRDHGGSEDSALELLIPILAVTLIFGTPIIVVIAVLYAGYRKRRLVQETISQYLASGKDVPPEILENLQGGARPKNYLQKGLVMTGAGVGIIGCFAMMGWTGAAALGLIPLFIGLAQLLIWKMERDDEGAKDKE